MSTTPSVDHSPSPPTVTRGAEHLGPPSILQQIRNMLGTLEGDSCPSAPIDRPDNLSEWWLSVIQESLLRLLERGRVGPPRSGDIKSSISGGLQSLADNNTDTQATCNVDRVEASPTHTPIPRPAGTLSGIQSGAAMPAPPLLFAQSVQVPLQDIPRMPRNPDIEAEVVSYPDTFLLTPGHSPPPHEPSHSINIPPPSRSLGLHLRQATPTGVLNSVPTPTDTTTTTLFSTEIVPSQLSLHVPGGADDGEAGQRWNQDVAFGGTQPPPAPMPPPQGQTFPSQSKQPVLTLQPSALDPDVILKLLRDNRGEQQTILEQQREILACLRDQRDVHEPHADALARLDRTLHKEVIPLMKQIAQEFVSDFPLAASDVNSQVEVDSPPGGPPIRALNMFAPGRISQAEPSSSYGQFPVAWPTSIHPSPTSEYFPGPLTIRRMRTEFRSPSPEPESLPPPPPEPDGIPWDVIFEAGFNGGSVGSPDPQDAEETEETHYCPFPRGIDSSSRQQSPTARDAYRREATCWQLDSEDDRGRMTERVLPLEGVAQPILETPPGPSTWSRAIESISDSESVPPEAQAPTWRARPREQDRMIALENELVAMRQQLDSDRALRMVEFERQINSNVASWGDMLEQACRTTPSHRADMHTMNTDNTPKHEPPATVGSEGHGQRRRPQPQALNAAERQRIIFEGSIRNMTETWRADWERDKVEIIDAIKAAANLDKQLEVPYNDMQAWHPPSTDADEQWTPPLPPEKSSNLAGPASPRLPPVPEIFSSQCAQLARAVESSFAGPPPPRSVDTPAAGMSSAATSLKSDAPASLSQFDIIDVHRAAQEQLGHTTPARPQRVLEDVCSNVDDSQEQVPSLQGSRRAWGSFFFRHSKDRSQSERSEQGKSRSAPKGLCRRLNL